MPKLSVLFDQLLEKNRAEAEERRLWLQTPEGRAWREQEDRLVAADEAEWFKRQSEGANENEDED